ncbi:hypothetical protein [Streptomyces sp. NPDC005549]|uniref:hypothetical protein n=1 Tax=Streptomyces sp. NPDC005549 TaxID=3154888 RepID=UPI0033B889FB
MTESEADLLALLRELDDPGWLEWPQHYDRGEAAMHFGVLVARLEGDFAARCTADRTPRTPASTDALSCPGTQPYAALGSSSA